MLLVAAISILKKPNTMTVLLEYIIFLNINHDGNMKQLFERSSLSLASYYHIFKPN